MGALDVPLMLRVVEPPDPETLTAQRRENNEALAEFGAPPEGPSRYELDWYAEVGRTPPTD